MSTPKVIAADVRGAEGAGQADGNAVETRAGSTSRCRGRDQAKLLMQLQVAVTGEQQYVQAVTFAGREVVEQVDVRSFQPAGKEGGDVSRGCRRRCSG